ncbi:MAG TPA: hypothetical protein PL041_04130 [Melioribacteraceae bacterium]|nr:hypothetical protein [Melioribacteraceae bacterium]
MINNKYIKLFLVLVVFAVGCKTLPPIEYENSNQLFIERTVDKLDLGKTFPVPQGQSIALVSLENDKTIDIPVVATIEDQLVRSLLKNQFVVLERDNDMLKRLLRENHPTDHKNGYSILTTDSAQTFVKMYKTHLKSADYLVSYRVLECGLIYGRNIVDGFIDRNGVIRLHVRIQKVDSGEIVYADNLTGTYKDRVIADYLQYYENFHFNYFQNSYPLQK